jgi:hypothetical protein
VSTVGEICPDPRDPLVMPSPGGDGGESACTSLPMGDPREVQRVIDAVRASQEAAPANPAYIVEEYDGPGPMVVATASWYRVNGEHVQILFRVTCPDRTYADWFTVTPDGVGSFVPQVSAARLAAIMRAEVVRQLPMPVPRIGPADEDEDGWTYVNNRTFFWIDQGPGQWEVVSGSTSAGGVSVTVRAEPVRLVVDPGDGSEPVVCEGAPPAVTRSSYAQTKDRGCAHTYTDSSAMAPNGLSFPVTVSIVWHASWSASTGEGGDLGYLSTTSTVRELQVAEIQAVITGYED